MKKVLAVLLALAMLLGLAACGGKGKEDDPKTGDLPTIQFWSSGSQNVSDIFTELIAVYNAKADRKANVELQFILSGTGDAGLKSRYGAAYKTGNTSDFDMIAENGSDFLAYVQEAGSEDAFLTLDTSKLSNYPNVKMKASIYPEKLVPYRGTTVVFAYDSAKLPEPPKTWDELVEWCKANPGKFTYNDPDTGGAGQAFVFNAIYRQIALKHNDPDCYANGADEKYLAMYDDGFKWLADLHPYLYSSGGHIQYAVKNQGALDLLAQGEVWMVPAWADGTLTALEQKTLPETVKMYQLSDLSLTGTDVDLAICSKSEHVDECYDFMNFVISAEAQQILVEHMKAVPVVDASTLEQTDSVKAVAELNPAEFNILSIGSNGTEIKSRWTQDIATLN